MVVVACLLGWIPDGRAADAAERYPLRIGFSGTLFTGMNENDARAAVRGWGQTIAREHRVPVTPEPKVLTGTNDMGAALKSGEVDVVGMLLTEYAVLNSEVELDPLMVTHNAGGVLERYVVLVRQDSEVRTVADLAGRSLNVYRAGRMCLAEPWLDLLATEAGIRHPSQFPGARTRFPKISLTILPVFFGRADACLVLRSGFETMAELNPQLRSRLRVVAESGDLVPLVFAFRADYRPPFRTNLVAAFENLHTTPAGQQALTIFHCEKLSRMSPEFLGPSLELHRNHARIVSAVGPARGQ